MRLPEAFGDEVDHSLFGLEGPGDAEDGGGFGQGGVLREDSRPEDDTPACLAFTCLRFLPARGLASVFAYNLQRNPITTHKPRDDALQPQLFSGIDEE